MKLCKNIGTSGRWMRGGIGAVFLVIAYWKMSWIALVIGLFTLFEAVMSWCILYQILGKSSCPIKKKRG